MKKGPKSGNRAGNAGGADRDLWQFVTRSIRPYGQKPPSLNPTPKTAQKALPAAPARSRPAPPAPPRTLPLPVTRKLFDPGEGAALRRGKRNIEARLDLHGMTQGEAYAALHRSLRAAQKSGRRTLLVITGKGRVGGGVLRRLLPLWLEESELRSAVLAFAPAKPKDGGDGAFYVRLRKPGKA